MSKTQNILVQQKKYLDDLLKRRFIISPSFDIYGGVAGFYDFGPIGCALKNNLETLWREHFILEENMFEINTSCITPQNVLKASGHVDRFADYMIKDKKNGNVYRADKYLQEWIQTQLESKKTSEELKKELQKVQIQSEVYSQQELQDVFKKYDIKSKDNNELSDPEPFNLMFSTQIGPTGYLPGFLRPETAQGIFVNFAKLLDFNNGRLPFAGACLGLGFRNEIAPRSALLRVREFQMAEIEHFIDPQQKDHPKFVNVQDLKLPLWTGDDQVNDGEVRQNVTLKEAVETKLIDNESIAYFMGRTYEFLISAGIQKEKLRFRQHMRNEMAHYACDCWDAEIETSYGWIECVGHADRSAYDLNAHMNAAKVSLQASRRIDPIQKTFVTIQLNKPLLGKTFKQEQSIILNYVEELSEEAKADFKTQIEENKSFTFEHNGKSFTITEAMVKKIDVVSKMVQEEKFVPSVIEPSFGIGRILYAIMEHCFRMRDESRTYLLLPPKMAPVKCSILTVQNDPEFLPLIENIRKLLTKRGVSSRVDNGNQSIGKRYARTDELGIPFAITIDKDSLTDQAVTLREIESMKQLRLPIKELGSTVTDLIAQDK